MPCTVICSQSAQVTLLREYCQGPNEMMYVLPTGGYDSRKHSTLQKCAAAELSEEVRPSLHHQNPVQPPC